jgi:hypothetical protein
MIDVVTKIDPITKKEKLMEKGFEDFARVVRVVPRDDRIRKYIRHAITKVGFPKQGSCEWPNDQFTRNRIREGVVSIEPKQDREQAERDRQQRGVNRISGAKGADAPKD